MMNSHQSSHKAEATGRLSTASILTCTVFFFISGYLVTQKALFDSAFRGQVVEALRELQTSACANGFRFPGLECPGVAVVKHPAGKSREALDTRFARLPNLSAAVDKLQWNYGSESDAARLLTIVRALELGRHSQRRQNAEAEVAITRLLRGIWAEYPSLVAASACLYCGSSFKRVSTLVKVGSDAPEQLKQLAAGHPRLLTEIAPIGVLSPAEIRELALIHAELSGAGVSGTAEFIGSILKEEGNHKLLEAWVTKGLNGGRALGTAGLGALPREVVIAAWENGVRLGYDQVELSEYLVAQGYRPALRWVVWLESTSYKYLHGWSYERVEGQYESILARHTRFPSSKGDSLARFYSNNWASIEWEPKSGQWTY